MIEQKLKVLKKIAIKFRQENITWNVGASCMLYLKGFVTSFHDIDIMIAVEDIEKVKIIMNQLGQLQPSKTKANFKTTAFLEYIIEGVEVDIMAGFTIIKDNQEYYFPLTMDSKVDDYNLDGVHLPLATIEEWLHHYQLMERFDKVSIIESKKTDS